MTTKSLKFVLVSGHAAVAHEPLCLSSRGHDPHPDSGSATVHQAVGGVRSEIRNVSWIHFKWIHCQELILWLKRNIYNYVSTILVEGKWSSVIRGANNIMWLIYHYRDNIITSTIPTPLMINVHKNKQATSVIAHNAIDFSPVEAEQVNWLIILNWGTMDSLYWSANHDYISNIMSSMKVGENTLAYNNFLVVNT